MTIHDTNLMHALHEGQSAAYETIYLHFIKPLLHYIRQIVDDRQAGEDIAVETFARAFERHADFATVDKLKGFLYITAGNAAKDVVRHQTRTEKVKEALQHATELDESIEVAYLRTETARAIREAVLAVPGQPGQVLRLLFFEGKSLPEAASALNLSYHTIKNHRAKGLQLVRQHLAAKQFLSTAALVMALYILESP